MQKKSFDAADEITAPGKTRVEIVKVGGVKVMRSTFEPGWKWTTDIKPVAGTNTCQTHHLLCVTSGRLKVVMDDGTQMEVGPGEVADIPPGHDAWVVGDEPVVGIDFGANL